MRLLAGLQISCAWGQVLRSLLRHERHGVAELLQAMEMVTLDACPILVIKIVSSQVAVGFLSP